MPITKASSSAVAPGAKGDLVVGNATNDSGILGVGANDTVLTADSSTATGLKWAAPGGAGANWSLLNSGGTGLSGAQTVTVSGISAKDKIFVRFNYATTGQGQGESINFRFNSDTGSNYIFSGTLQQFGSTYAAGNNGFVDSGSDTVFKVANLSSSNDSTASGHLILTGGNASGVKIIQSAASGNGAGGTNHQLIVNGGIWNNSATVTSVSIQNSGSNFTGGTMWVYVSN